MSTSPPRKNVILITSDEMRSDAPGFMGNPDCKTPNLDRLAARGTVFQEHFAVFPKCVPSRVAMMTGRYTHTDGLRTVNVTNHLPKGDPNLMEHLRAQGYETAVFGLNHVWDHAWFFANNKKGAGASDYHSYTEGVFNEMNQQPSEWPPAPENGPEPVEELMHIDYFGRQTGTSKGNGDHTRARQATKYLKEVRDRDKPFYLQVNFGKPHPPYVAPEPYYSMYDRDAITPFPYDLPENATLHLRKQRELRIGNDVSEKALRELQCVYYAMCSWVDDAIGDLLKTIDEENLWEDTLIIFCSDHGDFAGQYGINEKWDTAMQDCILKVPMLMAGAGIPQGERVESLTEHVDVPDTVLEYLGMDADPQWIRHGQSMLPALHGKGGKDTVFADGGHEAPMRARFDRPVMEERNGREIKSTGGKQLVYKECPDAMARVKMVRTKDWKLAIRETGGNELFHISEDPHEMKNLYGNPAHNDVVMDLQRRLVEWTLRTDTDRPYQPTVGA